MVTQVAVNHPGNQLQVRILSSEPFDDGFVAQLVEHRTFNAGVTGSNPVGPTKFFG